MTFNMILKIEETKNIKKNEWCALFAYRNRNKKKNQK